MKSEATGLCLIKKTSIRAGRTEVNSNSFQFFAKQKLAIFLYFPNFGGGRIKLISILLPKLYWFNHTSFTNPSRPRKKDLSLKQKRSSSATCDLWARLSFRVEYQVIKKTKLFSHFISPISFSHSPLSTPHSPFLLFAFTNIRWIILILSNRKCFYR